MLARHLRDGLRLSGKLSDIPLARTSEGNATRFSSSAVETWGRLIWRPLFQYATPSF
jgi:hypothetical protein